MGEMAEKVASGAAEGGLSADAIVVARNHEEIIADLRQRAVEGDTILVKGSRGMRMEIVAEAVRHGFARSTVKGKVA